MPPRARAGSRSGDGVRTMPPPTPRTQSSTPPPSPPPLPLFDGPLGLLGAGALVAALLVLTLLHTAALLDSLSLPPATLVHWPLSPHIVRFCTVGIACFGALVGGSPSWSPARASFVVSLLMTCWLLIHSLLHFSDAVGVQTFSLVEGFSFVAAFSALFCAIGVKRTRVVVFVSSAALFFLLYPPVEVNTTFLSSLLAHLRVVATPFRNVIVPLHNNTLVTAVRVWALAFGVGIPPLLIAVATAILFSSITYVVFGGGAGAGNRTSPAQALYAAHVRCGRVRNALCAPFDHARSRYPMANTCQVPFFTSLSDILFFVFGYRTTGLFVEVGAYDGESFSNTSGLADLGWEGHYLEPIPQYADAARARHAHNAPRVRVHTVCIGEQDGETVELSAAGPFSSAVEDEITSVASSSLHTVLKTLGWGHAAGAPRVNSVTRTLDSFFRSEGVAAGAVDVMVVDTEGFEWPIFKAFPLAHWAPKLVIVEVQELQARYRKNARVQADAAALYAKFADAGYSILYKDVVNTIFKHESCECVGGA